MHPIPDEPIRRKTRFAVPVATSYHRGVPFKISNSGETNTVLFEVGPGFVGIPFVVSVAYMEVVDHECCDRYALILNRCTEYMGDARLFGEVSPLRLNWDWSDGK